MNKHLLLEEPNDLILLLHFLVLPKIGSFNE